MLNCIVLLLVVQFEFEFSEFEFELNCLNQFQKKMQSLSFLSLFFSLDSSPAQPLLFFSFLPRGPNLPRRPTFSLRPSPSQSPPPAAHRQAGPACRGHPLARDGSGLSPSPAAPRFHAAPSAPWRARQGGPVPPYKASPRAPLIP